MKKYLVVLAALACVAVRAQNGAAVSREALEKDEVAVLEIPELAQMAASGDKLPSEMDVQSYSLSASYDVVGTSITKNVVFQDLTISRITDEWTPLLLKAAIDGKKFKRATLEVRHPTSTMRVELSDVAVTSVSSSDNIPSNGSEGYLNVSYSFKGIALTQTKGRFKGTATLTNPPKMYKLEG
jgi:type VI protein secretion system component Hcp